MKFIVFYLEFINSLEGPGMFFSSEGIIRRLRSYAATSTKHVDEKKLSEKNDIPDRDISFLLLSFFQFRTARIPNEQGKLQMFSRKNLPQWRVSVKEHFASDEVP